MADVTRLPQGTLLTGVDITTTATPVGTLVLYSGDLYLSDNASTPSYTQVTFTGTSGGMAWPGQVTVQGVTVDVQPAEGETYTLSFATPGGVVSTVYTFTSTPTAATDVERDGTIAQIQAALEVAINANQDAYVEAIDYGSTSPIYLYLKDPANTMTQTDGTGGDLTIYDNTPPGSSVGPARIGPKSVVAPFHVKYQVSSVNVTEGFVIFPFALGWQPVTGAYAFTAYKSKGVDADSLEAFGCTATVTSGTTADGIYELQVANAGATPFANGDLIVLWGLMEYTG